MTSNAGLRAGLSADALKLFRRMSPVFSIPSAASASDPSASRHTPIRRPKRFRYGRADRGRHD